MTIGFNLSLVPSDANSDRALLVNEFISKLTESESVHMELLQIKHPRRRVHCARMISTRANSSIISCKEHNADSF
jgi:hypothetical protein